MSNSASSPAAAPTVEQLEAEIAERREHLSTTIDELVTRISPKEILRRQVESTRIRIAEVTHTPEGEFRTDLVAAALAGTAALLVVAGLVRRHRR